MENDVLIVCPECGKLSDSIKRFRLPHIYIFMVAGMIHQNIVYTCCPHCMRKHILMKCYTYNILLCNIAWPVLILPISIIRLIQSYKKGHSPEVLELLSK